MNNIGRAYGDSHGGSDSRSEAAIDNRHPDQPLVDESDGFNRSSRSITATGTDRIPVAAESIDKVAVHPSGPRGPVLETLYPS
jgi:hypothetical protein